MHRLGRTSLQGHVVNEQTCVGGNRALWSAAASSLSRRFAAYQRVEDGKAFGANPRNAREFEIMCSVQVSQCEEAGIGQGAGRTER